MALFTNFILISTAGWLQRYFIWFAKLIFSSFESYSFYFIYCTDVSWHGIWKNHTQNMLTISFLNSSILNTLQDLTKTIFSTLSGDIICFWLNNKLNVYIYIHTHITHINDRLLLGKEYNCKNIQNTLNFIWLHQNTLFV